MACRVCNSKRIDHEEYECPLVRQLDIGTGIAKRTDRGWEKIREGSRVDLERLVPPQGIKLVDLAKIIKKVSRISISPPLTINDIINGPLWYFKYKVEKCGEGEWDYVVYPPDSERGSRVSWDTTPNH